MDPLLTAMNRAGVSLGPQHFVSGRIVIEFSAMVNRWAWLNEDFLNRKWRLDVAVGRVMQARVRGRMDYCGKAAAREWEHSGRVHHEKSYCTAGEGERGYVLSSEITVLVATLLSLLCVSVIFFQFRFRNRDGDILEKEE